MAPQYAEDIKFIDTQYNDIAAQLKELDAKTQALIKKCDCEGEKVVKARGDLAETQQTQKILGEKEKVIKQHLAELAVLKKELMDKDKDCTKKLNDQLEKFQQAQEVHKNAIEGFKQTIKEQKEKISYIQKSGDGDMQSKIEALAKENARLKQLQAEKSGHEQAQQEIQQLKKQYKELDQKYEQSRGEFKSRIADAHNTEKGLQKIITNLKAQLETEKDATKKQQAKLGAYEATEQKDCTKIESKLNSLLAKYESLQKEKEGLEKLLSQIINMSRTNTSKIRLELDKIIKRVNKC